MDNRLPIISYTLAVVSSVCFIGGIAILSREGRTSMCTDSRKFYPYLTAR